LKKLTVIKVQPPYCETSAGIQQTRFPLSWSSPKASNNRE